uniref:Uncharacterized protein n=1 Tax=Rhodnius prolixus TaxID=13249 RepID=T1HHJ7_RHOPR
MPRRENIKQQPRSFLFLFFIFNLFAIHNLQRIKFVISEYDKRSLPDWINLRREAAHRQHSRWSFLHYWRLSRGQQRFNRRGGRSGIVVEAKTISLRENAPFQDNPTRLQDFLLLVMRVGKNLVP